MPRNFGIRNTGGPDFWHDNDNHRDPNWVFYAIGAAVVLMIAVGLFA